MSYTFDDAVHVLGLDLLTDDDAPPSEWDDVEPGPDLGGHQYTVTIEWDGDPVYAPWLASIFQGLARRHVDGCVVTYQDHTE
jgi:hypothetical protein